LLEGGSFSCRGAESLEAVAVIEPFMMPEGADTAAVGVEEADTAGVTSSGDIKERGDTWLATAFDALADCDAIEAPPGCPTEANILTILDPCDEMGAAAAWTG
jgi:hypothetical protein